MSRQSNDIISKNKHPKNVMGQTIVLSIQFSCSLYALSIVFFMTCLLFTLFSLVFLSTHLLYVLSIRLENMTCLLFTFFSCFPFNSPGVLSIRLENMTCLLFTFFISFSFQLTCCTQHQAGEYDLFIVYLFISCFPFNSPIVLSIRLENMTCLLFTFFISFSF